MRNRLPDSALALTLFWIWLAIVVLGVLAYVGFRLWRKHHPLVVPKPEPPYSQRLQQRLNEHRTTGKPSKRAKARPPERHQGP